MLLSKAQKANMVIKLTQEGKTTREIAELVHISLRDIGKIIKKETGEVESKSEIEQKEKDRLSKLSLCSQAFQLFIEKKSLPEVAIMLDQDADAILDYYRDYLRLSGMYDLYVLYNDLGKDLSLFLHLYNRIKAEGLDREEISYMVNVYRTVADLEYAVMALNKHIPELETFNEERGINSEINQI